MKRARPTTSSRRYLHYNGRYPFPVNPIFFGQTFVIGNLAVANRSSKNTVLIRNKEPISEGLLGKGMQRVAEKRFNAKIKVGYSNDIEEDYAFIKKLIEKGYEPVLTFHYADKDTEFAKALHDRLKKNGLRDKVTIIFYLHTRADNIVTRMHSEKFRRFMKNIIDSSDGVIGVSDSVIDTHMRIELKDKGGVHTFDPARAKVVRNGIDSHIYFQRTDDEVQAARRSIGLNPELERVVSYVGRLDKIKGSDRLAEVLEYFERSKKAEDQGIGFVIATPQILNVKHMSRYMKRTLRNERLIREGRLRFVLDVSKFSRGDTGFRDEIEKTLNSYGNGNGLKTLSENAAYGGMIHIPAQTISDIYLHPARSEALGLAVVEAVFSEIPVIATDVGGIPEVVNSPEIGQLHENGDKNLVKKLIRSVKQIGERVSEPSKKLVKHLQAYTAEKMFRGYDRSISEIQMEEKHL
jgi:glycosyltransferase involved in cell wall biosynthesis